MSRSRLRRSGSTEDPPTYHVPGWVLGWGAAVGFGLWRKSTVTQLPVWDGAMGVVPAALTLEGLGFDVARVLAMDDYDGGGPNTHSLSSYTWLVAGSIRLLGTYQDALPYLHLLSFCLIGLLAAGIHRAARNGGIQGALAILATALAVLFPPMVVQGSDVYLDLPVAAATTWAIALALEQRWAGAILAACVGASVKASALIAVPAIGVLMIVCRPRPWLGLVSLILPALIAVGPLALHPASRAAGAEGTLSVMDITGRTAGYLLSMPYLLILGLATAGLLVLRLTDRDKPQMEDRSRLFVATCALGVSYLAFFTLNPLVHRGVPSLPRYTTLLAPVLILGFLSEWGRRFGPRRAGTVACVMLVFFLVNVNGRLDPSSRNFYALAERSLVYEDFLEVQKAGFGRFEQLVGTMPTYYDHFAHYRLSYPETGWATAPGARGTPVWTSPDAHWREVVNLPDTFAMLIEGVWLGGQELMDIRSEILQSPEWSLETEVFSRGEFTSEVVIARRIAPPG